MLGLFTEFFPACSSDEFGQLRFDVDCHFSPFGEFDTSCELPRSAGFLSECFISHVEIRLRRLDGFVT